MTEKNELLEMIYETDARLATLIWDYLDAMNSVANIFFDEEVDAPVPTDIGERIEDPSFEISEHVDDWLNYCHIIDELVFRDLMTEEEKAEKDEYPEELAFRVMKNRVTETVVDLIRRTDAEVYRLTESGAERYDPEDEYNVYLDLIGLIHFRKPEERWAILLAKWSD